ncbi:hypothetical protein [Salinirubrum litoreum]|uniref:Uncharacterized protein n=1 Tax=Salinirubrum litoreum TaxID=1126234 RepID=A0ABD5RE47_9EURY|nr:hypothetical protein [Salinirubrum litoreum]
MRLRTPETTHTGDAIDLRECDTSLVTDGASSPTAALLDEIRQQSLDTAANIELDCPAPGPLHRFVGRLDGRPIRSRRRLLALAARSRGATAPQDDAIRDLRERLADCSPPALDLSALRRRVAEVGQREADLRERTATLRGALSARREVDAGADAVAEELAEVTAELADVETDRIAAEQALAEAERRAREARDTREHRLELQDALANRRRAARAHLAESVAEAVADAERAVPGPPDDPTTTRLAVIRVAEVEAPVVLAVERYDDAETASQTLGVPVIRV